MIKQLCGDQAMKHLTIVTNVWGEVSPEKGKQREKELSSNEKFFKNAIDKGAAFGRHNNTYKTAFAILRHVTKNQPIVLGIQDQMVNQGRSLNETAAAEELQREMKEQEKQQRAEMARYKTKAEESARRIEQERRMAIEREWQEATQRLMEQRQRELDEYYAEQSRMERMMEVREDAHRREMVSIRARMPQCTRTVSVSSDSSNSSCVIA
ncbi:hypothetical protein PILCRDRAFT_10725 [Piloderma croceum F 1598]|uniref:Uncharacterized protein n=1 Tax=Piloderma croceum (strain F 1598) TaxID=765440 RepID=A0A0C3F2N9_PILCF|nr:hypothetical protein PILCRDRAFT_10725 [Piloderma croceum F 1598]